MKVFFQIFCFVLTSSVVATGYCADSYRVRGEISYEDGQRLWSRTIGSDVVSGIPILIEQGEQTVSLVFVVEPPPSDKYSLTITLLTNPKSADGFSVTVLKDTFQSSLVGGSNGPLEFAMANDSIKISGAVGASLKR